MIDVPTTPLFRSPLTEWRAISIPELHVPFPVERSPHTAQAERSARAFVRRFGLVPTERARARHDTARLGSLMGAVYPRADSAELTLVTEWFSANLVLDDRFDRTDDGFEPGRVVELASQVLDRLPTGTGAAGPATVGPGTDPLLAAYSDLWRRTAERVSPSWQRRFTDHLRVFLDVCRWEAENRRAATVPGLEEYIARRGTAMHPYLDLIEVTTGVELPEPDDRPADLIELHQAVSDADLWTNDLFSCVQEAERGDPHNLVLVVAEARRCAPRDAVRDVTERVQSRIDAVARLIPRVEEHGVPGVPDAGLAEHLHSLRCWVSGQLAWRYETARFVPDGGDGW